MSVAKESVHFLVVTNAKIFKIENKIEQLLKQGK